MGIGKNWKFEEDFVSANTVPTHAYDHTVTGTFWLKFFIKGFLSALIGKANGPSEAIKTYHSFKRFFNDKATHYKEQVGGGQSGHTNLKKSMDRLEKKPLFLKVDIEGSEYEILEEIISFSGTLSGLAIEFHKVSEHVTEIENFINRFELQLVHTHPNNNRVNNQGDSEGIEMTFSRDPLKIGEQSVLPHPLDQDNVPRKQSVGLSFLSN
tara:strand:+ start:1361 stop:1990 length:630 start_codon:yes stop_codon:yes gene_type:complete